MRALNTVAAIGGVMLSLVSYAPAAPIQAPATMHVVLPASATLIINGLKTTSTSGERWFTTPALDTDKSYAYTLKAEMVVDGKTVAVERQVTVQGGREANVTLEFANSVAAVATVPQVPQVSQVPQVQPQPPASPTPAPEWPSAWTGN